MTVNNSTIVTKVQPETQLPDTPRIVGIYQAFIWQSGTNAPTTTELKNTIGEVEWTRTDVGRYNMTCTGAFSSDNTTIIVPAISTGYARVAQIDNDTLLLQTLSSNVVATFVDNALSNNYIEVRVYQLNNDYIIKNNTIIQQPNPKQYIALLNQSGTNDPETTILRNQIGEIIWTRDSIGQYIGTKTGAFTKQPIFTPIPNQNTWIQIGNSTATPYYYTLNWLDDDNIILFIKDATNALTELSTANGTNEILITINIYN